MLRVTLDIVPGGDESRTRTIGMLEIARTTSRSDPEDYTVYVWAEDGELVNIFTVEQHGYAQGAWELVRRALDILCWPEGY